MDSHEETHSIKEWGLNFARKLNFTETHYEEALKLIKSPNNTNQLLLALLDVSSRSDQVSDVDSHLSHKSVERSKSIDTASNISDQGSRQQYRVALPNSIQDVFAKNRSSSSSASVTGSSTTSSSSSNLISFTNFESPLLAEYHPDSMGNLAQQETQQPNLSQHQSTELSIRNCMGDVTGDHLRKIYIDGSNVARTHGKDVEFSWPGIRICVEWFRNRGHSVVKVILPEIKCQKASFLSSEVYSQDTPDGCYNATVLDYLARANALVKTPAGSNDDMFLLEAARLNNGVIVSNDLFREEARCNDELQKYIEHNKLPYIFDDDNFIPAYDPLGRYGPTRDRFLRLPSQRGNQREGVSSVDGHHNELHRTLSNHKFERRSVISLPKHHIGNSSAFQRRSLQYTHSSHLHGPHEFVIDNSQKLSNESMGSINLYRLQRASRDDLTRATSSGRSRIYKTSSSIPNCDNNKPNDTSRSVSSITHRNALIRTKSHT